MANILIVDENQGIRKLIKEMFLNKINLSSFIPMRHI